MLCYKLTWRIWWKIFIKKDLRLILKSDLFIAVEFNKAGRMGEWFRYIMNNCGAKTKNLRQFPVRARCWVSLLSGVTFYIGRVMLSSGGVSVLCFSSSLKYSHCGWLLFSSRLFFPEHPLWMSHRVLVSMEVLFLLQAWRWRCLSDCILLMNKLFATIGNCFCSLITQVFVVKSSSVNTVVRRALVPPRMSSEWDIYWKRNWKLRACSIFHTMLALIDGGPARLKSNDLRNDIFERLQRILELLCFFPM